MKVSQKNNDNNQCSVHILACKFQIWCSFSSPMTGKQGIFWFIESFRIKLTTKNKFLLFNCNSILMYYYHLPQKGWSWLIFLDQSEALVVAITPIASSVGIVVKHRRSHRSLAQVLGPIASPIAAWLKKNLPLYLIFSIIRKIFFFGFVVFRSRPTKMNIGFEFCTSKYI